MLPGCYYLVLFSGLCPLPQSIQNRFTMLQVRGPCHQLWPTRMDTWATAQVLVEYRYLLEPAGYVGLPVAPADNGYAVWSQNNHKTSSETLSDKKITAKKRVALGGCKTWEPIQYGKRLSRPHMIAAAAASDSPPLTRPAAR